MSIYFTVKCTLMTNSPSRVQLASSWIMFMGFFALLHLGYYILAPVVLLLVMLVRPDKRGYDSSTSEFFDRHQTIRRMTYLYYVVLVMVVLFNTDSIRAHIIPNRETWILSVLVVLGPVLVAVASNEIQLFRQATSPRNGT